MIFSIGKGRLVFNRIVKLLWNPETTAQISPKWVLI
jgi:hypothetical protein